MTGSEPAVVGAVKGAAVSAEAVPHDRQIPDPQRSLPAKVLALLLGHHPPVTTSPKATSVNVQKQVAGSSAKLVQAPPAVPQPIPVRSRKAGVPAGRQQKQKAAAVSPESRDTPSGDSAIPVYPGTEVLERLQALLQPTTPQEHKLNSDCYLICDSLRDPATGTCPLPDVALHLRARGWVTLVRKVIDTGTYWSKSMSNSFCYCLLPVQASGSGSAGIKHQGYVIDPHLKDHFAAAMMTCRYRDIWEALPPLFVGPASQLVPLLQLLCHELACSFSALGCQLPPWRSYTATLGRWLSQSFQDVATPSPLGLEQLLQQQTSSDSNIGARGSVPHATLHPVLTAGGPSSQFSRSRQEHAGLGPGLTGEGAAQVQAFREACAAMLQPVPERKGPRPSSSSSSSRRAQREGYPPSAGGGGATPSTGPSATTTHTSRGAALLSKPPAEAVVLRGPAAGVHPPLLAGATGGPPCPLTQQVGFDPPAPVTPARCEAPPGSSRCFTHRQDSQHSQSGGVPISDASPATLGAAGSASSASQPPYGSPKRRLPDGFSPGPCNKYSSSPAARDSVSLLSRLIQGPR